MDKEQPTQDTAPVAPAHQFSFQDLTFPLIAAGGAATGYLIAKHYHKSVMKGAIIGAIAPLALLLCTAVYALRKMT